jgi:hypothetical protein
MMRKIGSFKFMNLIWAMKKKAAIYYHDDF